MEESGISSMQEKYDMYKEGNVKFLRFNPDEETSWNETTFSRLHLNSQMFARLFQLLQTTVEHAPLEAVYIFFNTATYNQIERDVKVKKDSDSYKTCI